MARTELLSLVLLSFSVAAWNQIEGLTAALLMVLTMFSAAGTLFVLGVAVVPRLTWGMALACAPALLLTAWGGWGG